MKKIIAIVLFSFMIQSINGQNYSNSWINYSQNYYKFPISKEGIYRIDSTTLSTKFNLNIINPKNFQLFIAGTEHELYIRGESDNKININDYLEFYANTNPMRKPDSSLYKGISYLPAPNNGLFNDTIYAFLTLNNSVANKSPILI